MFCQQGLHLKSMFRRREGDENFNDYDIDDDDDDDGDVIV